MWRGWGGAGPPRMPLPNQFRVSAPRLDCGLCRYCADHEGEARVLAAIAMAQQRGARCLARCPPHVVSCIRRAGCNKRAPTTAWLQVINFYCALLQRDSARNAAAPRCAPSGLGSPPARSHLRRDRARPPTSPPGLGSAPSHHICPGTGPTPPTSALRLRSPLPHLRRDWAVPPPHLRRDWAPPRHICAGTGRRNCAARTAAPSAGPTRHCGRCASHVACHAARCTPDGTLYARWHVVRQMARCTPDGTLYARWHVVRQMARCTPDGTLHAVPQATS